MADSAQQLKKYLLASLGALLVIVAAVASFIYSQVVHAPVVNTQNVQGVSPSGYAVPDVSPNVTPPTSPPPNIPSPLGN